MTNFSQAFGHLLGTEQKTATAAQILMTQMTICFENQPDPALQS
jgi:hypothetical protein